MPAAHMEAFKTAILQGIGSILRGRPDAAPPAVDCRFAATPTPGLRFVLCGELHYTLSFAGDPSKDTKCVSAKSSLLASSPL